MRLAVLTSTAAMAGASWSFGEPAIAPAAMVACGYACSRREAAAIAAAYAVGISLPIAGAADLFFADPVSPSLLVIGATFGTSGIWSIAWSSRSAPMATAALFALISLPPLGGLLWANPLFAAGFWFPGLGVFGLLAVAATVSLATEPRLFTGACAAAAGLSILCHIANRPIAPPDGIRGHNTTISMPRELPTAADTALANLALTQYPMKRGVTLLPETVAGRWTEAVPLYWRGALEEPGASVLVGVVLRDSDGWSNALVHVTPTSHDVAYRQRWPLPIALWRPWTEPSVRIRPLAASVAKIAGIDAGFLICWEQLLIWPAAQTFAQAPAVVFVASNSWWTTSVTTAALRSATSSMERLFRVPVVAAENSR